MNELDKKIAELKGWKLVVESPFGALEENPDGTIWHSPINNRWSTSDTKALELVDELLTSPGTRTPSFELKFHEGGIDKWIAQFRLNYWENPQPIGSGDTRPEAICRAYIAAVTWMKEKKG